MKLSLFLFLTLVVACSPHPKSQMERFKTQINRLPFTDTIWVLSVDPSNQTQDTLSIEKIKKDTNGNLKYSEKFNILNGRLQHNYYRQNEELCYRHTHSLIASSESFYETQLNDAGNISSTTLVESEDEKESRIRMNYYYQLDPLGKKQKLIILPSSDSIPSAYLITYNEMEKPLEEIRLFDSDTLKKQSYDYAGSIPVSSHSFWPKTGLHKESKYNKAGNLRHTREYVLSQKGLEMLSRREFYYDDHNQLSKIIYKDLEKGNEQTLIFRHSAERTSSDGPIPSSTTDENTNS